MLATSRYMRWRNRSWQPAVQCTSIVSFGCFPDLQSSHLFSSGRTERWLQLAEYRAQRMQMRI